jgi:hypothetical protein
VLKNNHARRKTSIGRTMKTRCHGCTVMSCLRYDEDQEKPHEGQSIVYILLVIIHEHYIMFLYCLAPSTMK